MDRYERVATRRELLRLGVAASVVAVWNPCGLLWGWPQEPLLATPSTTPGPFYPVLKSADRDGDLTQVRGKRVHAQGQMIQVIGRVRDQKGEPLHDAQVELWQANTFGRYDHPSDYNPAPLDPGFQGYGVQLTNREGQFRFTTIKPGPYPFTPTLIRAPHLHFEITGRVERRTTQMFFAGEPLNTHDFVLQSVPEHRELLIAELLQPGPGLDPGSRVIHVEIVLARG
jgi:protocatechuate 3,4-dioxygenase beta subunit